MTKKMKNIFYSIFLLLLLISPNILSAQGKQANNWYFGHYAGITFQQGSPPVALLDGQSLSQVETGTACMSDMDGNLLFYSNGKTIWNKNHQVMTNGDNMGTWSSQGGMIVQDPGNEYRYYFFNFATTGIQATPYKFQYSIIDMSNGIGEVLPDQKGIFLYLNTTFHLSAILLENMEDVWVVTHGRGINSFIAFKVTATGVITSPEISYAGTQFTRVSGYMKISSDGKWLGAGNWHQVLTELYRFDNSTGKVSNQNVVSIPVPAWGVEFSPDNTRFYAQGGYLSFYQYDLTSGDPDQIAASAVPLSTEPFGSGALQLGPDGKIYVGYRGNDGYLGVIHDPDKKGLLCNFEFHAVYLEGRTYLDGLPVFMQSYMRNPEFTTSQYCSGTPTQFNIVNTNGIDSVLWIFHDPGNAPNDTSTLFSPLYTFSTADTFVVELTAYSGLLHRTVFDTVIIYQTPTPNLGSDTTFCANETISLTLDAGEGQTYNWNGNFNPGGQTFNVTTPGTYWVRVLDHGCAGRDTINVIQYPAPIADITAALVDDASCGASDGSISGILLSGAPYSSMEWKNVAGVTVGTDVSLSGMLAGVYTLYIYYGNDCALEPLVFEIENTAAPQITGITPVSDHCSLGFGELFVNVLPGPGSPYMYSLDGVNFTNSAGFTGLTAGDYTVTVKDVNGCTDAMPVSVPDTPGPQVTDSIAVPENGYAGNGMITITANGDSVYYSLDGGTPQPGGTFSGLSAGDYTITVTDKWGCERLVFMTVDRLQGVVLSAVAGNDYKCMNELAYSTLSADNFIDVKQYKAVLEYNNLMLRCTGYNPTAGFDDVTVTDYNGSVEVDWQSDMPVTLPGNVELTDLIFEATDWGVADIKWDTAWSVFRDGYGNTIASSLNPGVITISNPPLLQNSSPKTEFCEGELALIEFNYTGGTDPVNVAWQTPDNANVPGSSYAIDSIKLTQAGAYTIFASDANNCKDTLSIPITVYAKPASGLETTDTIWYEQSYRLEATPGYANYEWSTGDTIYYITVTNEGEYSVLIETSAGCKAMESVFMFDAFVPINVPNAFTPNGDGMNDSFRPIVNTELIRRYHLTIYNKWGQLLYETSNPSKGWDGEGAMAGVYVWVIDYENRVGKSSQMKGSVSLVK